ncbi:MAG: NERD domain-containing protein [Propionibacteriaceae bacterium]|nr:NERD domain-containing protein [Propionibacteriaceae bacterium]
MTDQEIQPTPEGDREMRLRFAGVCTVCGEEIAKGVRAVYSPATKSVHHVTCPSPDPGTPDPGTPDPGTAGASARQEYERRKAKDQATIQAQTDRAQAMFGQGLVGRIATHLAVDHRPRPSTEVWAQGAVGEERVAARLDALADVGVTTLHDRRIPGTSANIDHIAITPWGVWVIDTKRYIGKRPEVYTEGGFLGIGSTPRLKVGGRKKDQLVDGVLRQCSLVQTALGDSIQVRGLLCFIDSDWPLIGGDFTIRGIRVCWPKRLAKELLQPRTQPTVDTTEVSRLLATRFPEA